MDNFYIAGFGVILFIVVTLIIVIHQDYREKHPKASR